MARTPVDRLRRRRLHASGALLAGAILWMLGGVAGGQTPTDTPGTQAGGPTVLTSSLTGEIITPVIADFLVDGVERARVEGHDGYLVVMDTPGGLDTSMRRIIQSFLTSQTPVIVFVPPGGRAASAGALIAFAAHIAAMAPGTSIGAATPVDIQGSDISRKIIEDATAFAASVARARGRNVRFAEDAVRKGRAASAEEAERLDVIDLIAPDRAALLAALDGRELRLSDMESMTLRTADARLVAHELSFLRRVQQRLADPNLAFLFLSIGTLAIIYELANPGIGAGGIVGVILILLAMFSLSVLPVNTVGILLVLLAVILFIAEVFTPGLGVFAAGGIGALILGGLFLFRGSVGVSLSLILPVAITVGLFVVVAGRLALRVRRVPSATGEGQMLHKVVTVRSASGTSGQAFVEGAWWRIRSRDEDPLEAGQRVRVVEVDGLELIVSPMPDIVAGHEEG